MKRLLVPTDFSDNARHAMRVAAQLAARTGAQLELLHVNTAMTYAPPLPEYYGGELYDFGEYYENAVRELREMKNELAKHDASAQLSVETRVEEGFLYAALRRAAREDEVDVIVMGTKGASGVSEFFIGSNTEKTIRTAPCPVLAVPVNSGDFNPRTVVLPTTLRPDQAAVFSLLAQWQRFFPIKIKVLYINNPAELEDDAEIDQAVQEFGRKAGLQHLETFVCGNTFNEEIAILEFAQKEKADLIAMATHQRQGLSHLLFGSLTEDTANHSSIPVLSVPAGSR